MKAITETGGRWRGFTRIAISRREMEDLRQQYRLPNRCIHLYYIVHRSRDTNPSIAYSHVVPSSVRNCGDGLNLIHRRARNWLMVELMRGEAA